MDMDEPELWNYLAIDSLKHSLLEQSTAIITPFKKRKGKKMQLVDDNFIVI